MSYPGNYARINRNKDPLEMEADRLLADLLKDSKSNKAKTCDILSDSQMARRQRREVPFSYLSTKDKLRFGIPVEGDIEND